MQARRPAEGLERRLDRQGAAAAHRVDKAAIALPPGGQDHGRGQGLLHGRFERDPAVAPPGQRRGGGVEVHLQSWPFQ